MLERTWSDALKRQLYFTHNRPVTERKCRLLPSSLSRKLYTEEVPLRFPSKHARYYRCWDVKAAEKDRVTRCAGDRFQVYRLTGRLRCLKRWHSTQQFEPTKPVWQEGIEICIERYMKRQKQCTRKFCRHRSKMRHVLRCSSLLTSVLVL